ncbi:hypothetical protein GGTG_05706 [Gaeumannomyces tritici R3-111a-1]|uniref:Uncharacterized protein n=1 Tax=Gaeumannomyces tritici (strain R3-111a-1) TaxID=644352 RepID=J3NWP4_GAET3|nr:hypothetical protein GGTG_05706 [Gaeumannomyces tritici R3-111a-1]EJT75776.1 hypothetical protein GGTG_05706 [Gaeumannomyces tritici R3-111a-1]
MLAVRGAYLSVKVSDFGLVDPIEFVNKALKFSNVYRNCAFLLELEKLSFCHSLFVNLTKNAGYFFFKAIKISKNNFGFCLVAVVPFKVIGLNGFELFLNFAVKANNCVSDFLAFLNKLTLIKSEILTAFGYKGFKHPFFPIIFIERKKFVNRNCNLKNANLVA